MGLLDTANLIINELQTTVTVKSRSGFKFHLQFLRCEYPLLIQPITERKKSCNFAQYMPKLINLQI